MRKNLPGILEFFDELDLCNKIKPVQCCDNESVIYFWENKQENLTKHANIKCQFIRSLINESVFVLKYLNSKDKKADFLTKSLLYVKFQNAIYKNFEL